jgi:hypothetical protein
MPVSHRVMLQSGTYIARVRGALFVVVAAVAAVLEVLGEPEALAALEELAEAEQQVAPHLEQ